MQLYYAICACAPDDKNGGIYTYTLTERGKLALKSHLPLDRPMYAVYENGNLYAIRREVENNESDILSIKLHSEGNLTEDGAPMTTHGIVACHLAAKDGDIYAANYLSGSIVRLPDTVVSHKGHGSHPRQERPHPHSVIFSPNGKYVISADLGLDKIFVMHRDLSPVSEASVPAENGARHLVFSPDGKFLYCIGELSATVSLFRYEAGHLHYLYDSAPAGVGTASALRLSKNGEFLFTAVRGENTISVYRTNGENAPVLLQKTSCGGNSPRDILLTPDEKFLLSANQMSNDVTVFALENGLLGAVTDRISLPAPLCITQMPL